MHPPRSSQPHLSQALCHCPTSSITTAISAARTPPSFWLLGPLCSAKETHNGSMTWGSLVLLCSPPSRRSSLKAQQNEQRYQLSDNTPKARALLHQHPVRWQVPSSHGVESGNQGVGGGLAFSPHLSPQLAESMLCLQTRLCQVRVLVVREDSLLPFRVPLALKLRL